MKIPILDLKPQYDAIRAQLHQELERVMVSGSFIMGADVAKLEEEICAYAGSKYAIAVNSGTDALVIALKAMGVHEGDEVITSTFSFFATAEAISILGAKPILVDIEENGYNLDVDQVERSITSRTKAIIPVHLFGLSARMEPILAMAKKNNICVLEDCAQCFGARDPKTNKMLGTLGSAGALSFFPSKNLGAMGDGGMILTQEEEIAQLARSLRVHGAKKKYYNEMIGYNSRLDTLQAVVLRLKLPFLDPWNEERRKIASWYKEELSTLQNIQLPEFSPQHVFHQFTVRIKNQNRDNVQKAMEAKGIGAMVYYPTPIHLLPVYDGMYPSLPRSETAAQEVLSLPMGPGLTREKVRFVCQELRNLI